MSPEFVKKNLGKATFAIIFLWFFVNVRNGGFLIEENEKQKEKLSENPPSSPEFEEREPLEYDIDVGLMHSAQKSHHNGRIREREDEIPDYLIPPPPPPPHIPIVFAPLKLAPIGAPISNAKIQAAPSNVMKEEKTKSEAYEEEEKDLIEVEDEEDDEDEKEKVEEKRDPFTHCKPGQKYSDVEPFINKHWMLNLSRDKYTAREMHELLIHRLTDEEKEDWICKIFGTRLEEQENKEEEVKISFYYKGRYFDKYLEDPTFDPDFHRNGVTGFGYKMCGNCKFTTNDDEADALIIDNGPLLQYQRKFNESLEDGDTEFKNLDRTYEPPSLENRNLSQYWVFVNYDLGAKNVETQSWLMPKELDSSFNITYSYRRDSDIVRGYNSAQNILRDFYFDWNTGESMNISDTELLSKLLLNKSELKKKQDTFKLHTAWMVSNCNNTLGAIRRWRYGEKMMAAGLKEHIRGEGACFDKITEREFRDLRSFHDVAHEANMMTKMRFYLAFENAFHCTDYISEKFWRNALRATLVPVVYGPHYLDVAKVAPPNSFIHAEQFASAEDLVYYMDYLWKNDTAYLDYHRWRLLKPENTTPRGDSYRSIGRDMYDFCRICRLVREKRSQKVARWYRSVMKFWRYDVHDQCKVRASFPRRIQNIEHNLVEVPLK